MVDGDVLHGVAYVVGGLWAVASILYGCAVAYDDYFRKSGEREEFDSGRNCTGELEGRIDN